MPATSPAFDAPVAAAVATAFDLGRSLSALAPVAGALSHRMWRLRTTGGSYAVKQFLNPWEQADWQDWLGVAADFELACWDAKIPMPRPVQTEAGGVLAEVATTAGSTATVRAHHWIDAVPCPDGAVPDVIAVELGAILADIHALGYAPPRRDVFPVPSRDSVQGWPSLTEQLQETHPDLATLAVTCTPLVRAVDALFPLPDNSTAPMGHGDVAGKNVLLGNGQPLLCDWDVAGPWRPAAELARTALALADWTSPETVAQVLDGYRGAGGGNRPIRSEDLALDLVIDLDWVGLCFRRAAGLRQAPDVEVGRRIPAEIRRLQRKIEIVHDLDRWLGQDRADV